MYSLSSEIYYYPRLQQFKFCRIRKEFDNVRYSSTKSISSVLKAENPRLVYNYIRRNIMTELNKTVLHNYLLRYRSILLEIYLADKDVVRQLHVVKLFNIPYVPQ